MSLGVQFQTIMLMFLGGGLLGTIFDVYRVLTRELMLRRAFIEVLDFLYWILGTILIFRILYESNQGEVRFYVFLGLLAGIWTYYHVISSAVLRAVTWIVNLAKRLIKLCIRLFHIFVIVPIKALYKLSIIIFGFIIAVSVFIYKIVLQLLYPVTLLFKWIIIWWNQLFK